MKWKRRILITGLLLGLVAAYIAQQIIVRPSPPHFRARYDSENLRPFIEAESYTVSLLDPRDRVGPWNTKGDPSTGDAFAERFQNYRVLGSAVMPASREIQEVIADLDAAAQDWNGAVLSCFNPRHGIRVTKGSTVYELLICYECAEAETYIDGKRSTRVYLSSKKKGRQGPERMNALLTSAGIVMPKS